MLLKRKTRRLYRLEGSVQTGGAIVRHGSSGTIMQNGHGKQQLHKGTQSKHRRLLEDPKWSRSAKRCFEICAEVWPNSSGAISAGCPVRS